MIRQSLLESWRRNFCEKQLKNGAWDLGGSSPSSPRGRLGPAEAEPSLPCRVTELPRPTMGSGVYSKNLDQLKNAF